MAEDQTHVFRASLRPKVYRDFEIPSANNLYDLGGVIVQVFGFDFDHPFGFYSSCPEVSSARPSSTSYSLTWERARRAA